MHLAHLQRAMTEERGARETLAQLAENQEKKIRVLEVSKQQLVRNLLAMRIELENVKSGNQKSSADELERVHAKAEHDVQELEERLAGEQEKNEVAISEITSLNAELLRKEQELQYCKRTLDEVEHERNTSLASTAKARQAAEVHSALARERMWSAEVNAASAQHLLGVVEERAAFSERKQAFHQNGGFSTDAKSAAPLERRTSPLDMKRLFMQATDDGSTPLPRFPGAYDGVLAGAASLRAGGGAEKSPAQTLEPDGDLMLSEARKLMVTKDLDVALSAHASYHKFKATKSSVEGSPKALEALEPVDRTRLVHSKYAEFAAMVQAKTDRSLETRAEIAALEGRVEELVQQNEEMKSRHANDVNAAASQKKIEALRLNETAEMCQSITAKFTVFQGSCLMKVQTLHNKIIDFDLLLEKLRRSQQLADRRSKSAKSQVNSMAEKLKEKSAEFLSLQSDRESLATRCKEHEAFIEKVLDDLKGSKVEVEELRRMAQESKNSNLGLQSEAESLQQQYREAAENFAAKDSIRKVELNEAEERIAELQQALEASEESLAAAREELQETVVRFEDNICALKSEGEQKSAEMVELGETVAERDAKILEQDNLLSAQEDTLNRMEQDALDFAEKCSSLADANAALELQLLESQKSLENANEVSQAEAYDAASALAALESTLAERNSQLEGQEVLLAEASKALDEERAVVQQLEDASKRQEDLLLEATQALEAERSSVSELEERVSSQETLLQEASQALDVEKSSAISAQEQMQEQLARQEGLLREATEALDQEKTESSQLRDQLQSQEGLLQQASQALDSDRDQAEATQSKLRSKITAQEATIEEQDAALLREREKNVKLEDQVSTQEILLQQASEALENEQRAYHDTQEHATAQEAAATERAAAQEALLVEAAQALDSERKRGVDLSEKIAALDRSVKMERSERDSLAKELAAQENLLEAASAALETERKEVEEVAQQKDEISSILKSVEMDLSEKTEKLKAAEAECIEKKEEVEILNLRLEEADVACQSAAETVALATEQRAAAQAQVADLNSQIVGFESKIQAEKKKSDRIVQQLSGQLVASGKSKEASIAQDLARMAKTLENTTDPSKREQLEERIQQLQLLLGGNPSGGDRGLLAVENALEAERTRRQQVEKDLENALDRQFASQQETERMLEEFEVIVEENKILAEELRALKEA